MGIKFGSAGNPDRFYNEGHKASAEMPAWLKANGLTVLETVCECSARLVVNRVSMKTKRDRIREIIDGLADQVAKLNN